MFVYPKYEALMFDGSNVTAFEGFANGLYVYPYGEAGMMCSKDGGETILEAGDYVIRRPGELHYVKSADFSAWWDIA